MNVKYCDNHFTIYTYVESLCCTLQTYTVPYVNYISIKLDSKRSLHSGK